MNAHDMKYTLTSDKPFDTVVANLERLAPEKQFRVLSIHDIKASLEEKGFQRDSLKIVEVCNAGFASQALQKNIDVALFMPCKYSVYVQHGKTHITLARPMMISQMMPESGLEDLAASVENTLKEIMRAAV